MQAIHAREVSFDDELLILVDAADNVTGFDNKANAHRGGGLLHRAFSVFLFNNNGQVLLHKRSQQKPLWPGFWTNSCCSHPRKGESYEDAAQRRLDDELGVRADLNFLYRFQYTAEFGHKGSENELCAVYVGRLGDDQDLAPNPNEIADWCWVSCTDLDRWLCRHPEKFTPWFKLEWQRLCTDQRAKVIELCRAEFH
jgi:isopentenyl-diphosphate delta-isomerase